MPVADPDPYRRHSVLADAIADWASLGSGPLYVRLASAIRLAIERDEIPQGMRLPPERTLAAQLAVSRKTVLSAFEMLKEQCWLASRQGSGTWVTLPPGRNPAVGRTASLASLNGILRGASGTVINMTSGQLEATPFLREVLTGIDDPEVDSIVATEHSTPLGCADLITAIHRQMTVEGVPADPAGIIVTTGAQQALSLLAGYYLRPGALVVAEPTTSLGALDVFRTVGARVESICDEPGYGVVDRLIRLATRRRPALIYVIPTFHNVTGSVMSTLERRRLAQFAADSGTPVIEDRSHTSPGYSSRPLPPPLASFGQRAQISVVDSMTKRSWPGLRLGWIVAGADLIGPLSRAKSVADLGTSRLSQYVAARLLGIAKDIDAERVATATRRLNTIATGLREHLPEWEWHEPLGGLSLWIRLPGADARQYAQHAFRGGVAVTPGPLVSATGQHTDHIRLSFHLPEPQLRKGIRRLASSWATHGRPRPVSR